MCTCSESHQNCLCYWDKTPTSFCGDPPRYYSPHVDPYSGYVRRKAWHRDTPKRKSRRVVLIRDAWQHVIDFEDWVGPIHTIMHHQLLCRYEMDRYRYWYVARETTQECLSSIE